MTDLPPAAESSVRRWERRTEVPLAGLAIAFLVAYALPILDTGRSPGLDEACRWANYLIWIVFGADYVVRLVLARSWRYFVRHLPDLAMVALPTLRPLRLVRLLMLLRILDRRASSRLHGRVLTYVAGSAVILMFCASLAVLDAERGHPGANIENFGSALWWTVSTVSTVGYGDVYPVTTTGRFVAAGLMVGGIALIGAVTATIASWLVDRVREVAEQEQTATRADVDALRREIAALREDLARRGQ